MRDKDDVPLKGVYGDTIPEFTVEPFSENCFAIYGEREHVVVGVSPGNSYFNVSLLADLLGWLCKEFRRVDVVVPDAALIHNYLALGYPPDRAARKTRAEVSVLRNRVDRAWQTIGGRGAAHGLHLMSELSGSPVYRRLHQQVQDALGRDAALRNACQQMSREVLSSRWAGTALSSGAVEHGVQYLVAELPFFLDSAAIFGVPSSLCFYHEPIPLAQIIFSRESTLSPSPRQAYAIIRPHQVRDTHATRSVI